MVEVERDKYYNDEQVYYFLMGRAPARSRGWNGGMGLGGWEVDGV